MAAVITNLTANTPLGFGALGITVAPGESVTVADFGPVAKHPVVQGWIADGLIEVSKPERAEPEPLPVPKPSKG